jgi:hypothetical protein
MPLIDKPPHIRQLEAGLATLQALDWESRTGLAGIHVRHYRHRHATSSERPCVSLRWLGNDRATPDGQYLTQDERQKVGHWQVEIDIKLETEEAGTDPTGWGDASIVAAAGYEALSDPASPLRALCDWTRPGDETPDEDSKPDDGRLVYPFDVIYRVRTDDPNKLLVPGENA